MIVEHREFVTDRVAVRQKCHQHHVDDHWVSNPGYLMVPSTFIPQLFILLTISASNYRTLVIGWIICSIIVICLERKDFIDLYRNREGWKAVVTVFGILFLAPLWISILVPSHMIRNYRARKIRSVHINDSSFDSRVTCIGESTEIASAASIRDFQFEPRIFLRDERTLGELNLWTITAGIAITLLWIVILFVVVRGWLSLTNINDWVFMFAFYSAPMLFWLITKASARLFAEYYRVAPGRIDVMKFTPLRSKGTTIHRILLRDANVVVDYSMQQIFIITAEPSPKTIRLSLTNFSKSHEFAEAVMLAAISTCPTPPLPDGEFIG